MNLVDFTLEYTRFDILLELQNETIIELGYLLDSTHILVIQRSHVERDNIFLIVFVLQFVFTITTRRDSANRIIRCKSM